MLRTLVSLLLLELAQLWVIAAQSRNTLLGTWKLNTAKSSVEPGPLSRQEVRTYEASGANAVKLSLEGIDASGNRYAYGYVAGLDGKDYPLTGTGTRNGGDSVAITRLDLYTVDAIVKRKGEVVSRSRLVVAKDGKRLTITEHGTNANGQSTQGVRVYERQ
jgi:hypothetical protein